MEIIIELKKRIGFEAEVEIIDKIFWGETNEEIDLQLSIGKPERGSLYWMLKVNAQKETILLQ
jgi:hypothetical protein